MVDLEDVKRLRVSLGLTQKQLAKHSDVSQSLIAKIESGRIDPAYSKAMQVIESLNSLGNEEVKAADLLNPSIIGIGPENSLKQAIQKMKKYGISQMPVIDDKKVVGLVSEAILLDGMMSSGSPDSAVRHIMHDSPPLISKNASVNLVTSLLREYPIILVSEKGKLIGQITKADILTKAFR